MALFDYYKKIVKRFLKSKEASVDMFFRKCTVCGSKINFAPQVDKIDNLRETRACPNCQASKRNIDMAECILKVCDIPATRSLSDSIKKFENMHIYELASGGPIQKLFSCLPNFVCSEYFDDVRPGDYHGTGIRCEDVQALTFREDTFHLVISQDVFEHVPNPPIGFREIHRILKPGGYHVFTVPFDRNKPKSITRSLVENGKIKYLLSPVYHGDPIRSEGALVFTDFGYDLIDSLKKIGFEVELDEKHYPEYKGGYNVVFITRKN